MAKVKIGSLYVSLSAGTARIAKDFKRANSIVLKFKRKTIKAMKSVASSVFSFKGAIAGSVGSAGIGLLIKSSLTAIDNIGKMSRLYRISTEDIGAMSLAAKIGGTELDTMLKAARNVSRQMFDFQNGVGEAKDAMEKMGITAKDIQPLMNDQLGLMAFLAEKVNGVTSAVDRLAIAQDIFGGRATVVLNALEGGQAAMEDFRKESEQLGGALSKDAVRGVESTNDSITRLIFLTKGLANHFTAALAPAIKQGVDALKDWIIEVTKSKGGIKGFARSAAISILESTGDIISGFQTIIDWIEKLKEKLIEFGVIDGKTKSSAIETQKKLIENIASSISIYEKFNNKNDVYNELLEKRETAYKTLQELEGTNISQLDKVSTGIDNVIKKIKERAGAEAAGGGSGGILSETGAETSVSAGLKGKNIPDITEQLNQRIVAIKEGFLSEEQLLNLSYANRAVYVAEWMQLNVDRKAEGFALLQSLESEHAVALVEIDRNRAEQQEAIERTLTGKLKSLRASVVSNALGLIVALGQKSKLFAKAAIVFEKATAIQRVLIQSKVAAMAALTPPPIGLGPVAGVGLAAKIASSGYASAGFIAATGAVQFLNKGSGGAVSPGNSANPINIIPENQQQSIQQGAGVQEIKISFDWENATPNQIDQMAESLARNFANGGKSPVAA